MKEYFKNITHRTINRRFLYLIVSFNMSYPNLRFNLSEEEGLKALRFPLNCNFYLNFHFLLSKNVNSFFEVRFLFCENFHFYLKESGT